MLFLTRLISEYSDVLREFYVRQKRESYNPLFVYHWIMIDHQPFFIKAGQSNSRLLPGLPGVCSSAAAVDAETAWTCWLADWQSVSTSCFIFGAGQKLHIGPALLQFKFLEGLTVLFNSFNLKDWTWFLVHLRLREVYVCL